MKTIIQGEKETFTIQLAVKDAETEVIRPYDLTGNTEITVHFKVGTSLTTKNRVAATVGVVILGADIDGKIKGTLEASDTALMPKSGTGFIEIKVNKGSGEIKKFRIEQAFQMQETAAA